jgi:2-dehydro-3-deoxyphosphooctonate aldolase (KDO 8-P synthase)
MIREASIGGIRVGRGNPMLLIAGPCVLESEPLALAVAGTLASMSDRLGIPVVFKGSYDKANRSSADSYRGPGEAEGLRILAKVRREFGLPVTTDIHDPAQAERVAGVVDLLQVPAFLCRQTDLLLAAGRTGRPVNVKKGQFMAPGDMGNAVDKVRSTGNADVVVTERGTTFGYNNLVVDFRGLPTIRESVCPVVFDATHSVQLPGGAGKSSSGDRRFVPPLARAAVAAGIDGLFLEVHPDPDKALSDGPNSLPLASLEGLLRTLLAIRAAAEGAVGKGEAHG